MIQNKNNVQISLTRHASYSSGKIAPSKADVYLKMAFKFDLTQLLTET